MPASYPARSRASSLSTAERQRDEALARVAAGERRRRLVRLAAREFLAILREAGVSTIDALHDRIGDALGDEDRRLLGAAVVGLRRAGVIAAEGYAPSRRRHCAAVPRWRIVSASAADAWLAAHPPIPEPTPAPARQLSLLVEEGLP